MLTGLRLGMPALHAQRRALRRCRPLAEPIIPAIEVSRVIWQRVPGLSLVSVLISEAARALLRPATGPDAGSGSRFNLHRVGWR